MMSNIPIEVWSAAWGVSYSILSVSYDKIWDNLYLLWYQSYHLLLMDCFLWYHLPVCDIYIYRDIIYLFVIFGNLHFLWYNLPFCDIYIFCDIIYLFVISIFFVISSTFLWYHLPFVISSIFCDIIYLLWYHLPFCDIIYLLWYHLPFL